MELEASQVSQYLRSNPQFFQEHVSLLTDLFLPHPVHGRAVSLTERQQLVLREKNQQLEVKLRQLVQYGEENDAISAKVHAFALALLRVPARPDRLLQARTGLQALFHLEGVAVRIWAPDGTALDGDSPVSDPCRSWLAAFEGPRCGLPVPEEAERWCAAAQPLGSLAVIRLQDEGLEGAVILGSADPRRFYPEMGTVYLRRLGELIAASLAMAGA